MWVKDALGQFFRRYGQAFSFQDGTGGARRVFGLLTPVKSQSDAPEISAGLRGVSGGQLIQYLGEPGPEAGGVLLLEESRYEVLRCEKMRLSDEAVYVRALVRRMEGEP